MNQAPPIRRGAGCPYFIPEPCGAGASPDTRLVPAAVSLSLLPAGPGMGWCCVYTGWYWWKQTVEACGTSSSGGLWEGAWDFPCSSSSSGLELTRSLLSRIYLGVTPAQELILCLLEPEVAWDTHYCLSRHGWFSNLNQMPTKQGFPFHLVRICLTVILLSGISTDLISPPPNETFCLTHYLYLQIVLL